MQASLETRQPLMQRLGIFALWWLATMAGLLPALFVTYTFDAWFGWQLGNSGLARLLPAGHVLVRYLVDALLFGLLAGAFQALVLYWRYRSAWRWLAASLVGYGLMFFLGLSWDHLRALIDESAPALSFLAAGDVFPYFPWAVSGIWLAAWQAFVLARWQRGAGWWAVFSLAGTAALTRGGLVTPYLLAAGFFPACYWLVARERIPAQ